MRPVGRAKMSEIPKFLRIFSDEKYKFGEDRRGNCLMLATGLDTVDNAGPTFKQHWTVSRGPPSATLTQNCCSIGWMCTCGVCWEPPSHVPPKGKDAHGTFDNHGQINDTVSLQPIHTSLFIYINTDLI